MRVVVQHVFTSEMATAAESGHPAPLEGEALVPGLQVDADYAPVLIPAPVGPGTNPHGHGQQTTRQTDPERATYLVRGELADHLAPSAHLNRHPDVVGIFSDPVIESTQTCGGDRAVGEAADIAQRLAVDQLAAKGMDGTGVALAVVDTGVSVAYLESVGRHPNFDAQHSWKPRSVTSQPGQHPIDHGTMCAFDAGIAAPAATLLDYPVLLSRKQSTPVMEGLLSDAVAAHGRLLQMQQALPPHYKSLVVTNSWGMFSPRWDFPPGNPGNYSDNADHPFNVIVASLVAAGADVLFAAGNCGPECPDQRCGFANTSPICGANSHPSVICVAGVDSNNGRVGYSSVGPGRLFAQKPDISAYTHFTGSQVFSPEPDSGTSAACPVAAGVVAAVRTRCPASQISPAQLKSILFQTAKDLGPVGFDYEYGWGVLDVPNLLSQLSAAGALAA